MSRFNQLANMAFCKIADIFGETGEIYYQSGSPPPPSQKVEGIFLNSSLVVGDGASVSNFVSTFEIKKGDYQAPKKGDGIRVNGELYKIAEVEKNSSDVLKLFLQKERSKGVKKK